MQETQSEAGDRLDLGDSENRTVKITDFDLLKVIGKGSFGKVILASHKGTRKVYAIKVLSKSQVMKRDEVCAVTCVRQRCAT
jgi:serine/threonine protein kinase